MAGLLSTAYARNRGLPGLALLATVQGAGLFGLLSRLFMAVSATILGAGRPIKQGRSVAYELSMQVVVFQINT